MVKRLDHKNGNPLPAGSVFAGEHARGMPLADYSAPGSTTGFGFFAFHGS